MGILYDLYTQVMGRKSEMDNELLSLGIYFEIKDSEIYGGEGSVGYAAMIIDIPIKGLQKVNFLQYANSQTEKTAKFCKVPLKKVRIITRKKYEENTDD